MIVLVVTLKSMALVKIASFMEPCVPEGCHTYTVNKRHHGLFHVGIVGGAFESQYSALPFYHKPAVEQLVHSNSESISASNLPQDFLDQAENEFHGTRS